MPPHYCHVDLFVCICSIVCIPPSLFMSRRACAHMFLYLHVYFSVCVCKCGLKLVMVCAFSRVTQSRSSLSFLPGPVRVIRAPPEGPLARWERCWRRPGPAVLLPSPSTGRQAQRVPLSCQAWRRGCLHSRRRVWTGQGAAASCRTHTCRKAPACTDQRAHVAVRPAPGGFDTCLEDAAEVRGDVWTNSTESLLQFVQVRNIGQN